MTDGTLTQRAAFPKALFDPAVPPPGQFSVYNALSGPKELFILAAGHFEYPDQPKEHNRLSEALSSFFNQTVIKP